MKLFYILIAFLIFNSHSVKAQKNILDIELLKDCEISIPIKHSRNKQEEDRKVAESLAGKELVIILTNKKGVIKKQYRGYIGIYTQSDAMATYFEPIESVISFEKKQRIYLLYNKPNTYCYDTFCYDTKMGIETLTTPKFRCPPKSIKASQFFGNGIIATRQKEYDLAARWFEYSVKTDTCFCEAWNHLGISHFMIGNIEKSYWSYINSMALDSTYSAPWINLFELFMFTGDTTKAIRSLDKLISNSDKTEYNAEYYKQILKELSNEKNKH